MKKHLFIVVPVLAVLMCSLLLLTTLDHRVYDLFLRAIPTLTEDDSVLIIKVDDEAIENVGLFPWPRDILADAIVFLREMGADTVVFDLSYLDNSPATVDPRYVAEELPRYLEYSFGEIDASIGQVMDAVAAGFIGPDDADLYKEQILELNSSIKESLGLRISHVTRDVDAYFAGALRLFGASYLTLTMVDQDDLIVASPLLIDMDEIGGEEPAFDMSFYDIDWLKENIALHNVTAMNDTRTPEQIGIIPAIETLLKATHGAGFVNAQPDADGYRRRLHLLMKYDGQYYGQLAFVPLLEVLGNPAIEVTNSSITLRDAHLDGTTQDIRIPRAEDGSVLVKWPKQQFREYNQISSWQLIRNTSQEARFVRNLEAMEESGFFGYWDDGPPPLVYYDNAEYLKELLFAEGEPGQPGEQDSHAGQDGRVNFEVYREQRDEFFQAADRLLNGGYEELLLSYIDPADTEIVEYVSEFFEVTRRQFNELMGNREEVARQTAGTFAIIGVDATSMTDQGLTTFQERFPNVGIHYTLANMILSQEFLDDAPPSVSVIVALVLALSLGVFIKNLDTKRSMLAGFALLLVSVLALLGYFMLTRRYIGVVVPFTSVSVSFLTLSGVTFFDTIREKSFLRSAFSRYLSPAVISEIIADPSKLNLGGEKREMTAIFTDIRGFSTFAEGLDPADLVGLLNMYLTEMSNIVLENLGTIDKYEGDAIIAFFGAPIHMPDHAVRACRTAIGMKQAEKALNARLREEDPNATEIFTRIGINTGDMVVGNMGTPTKMDYTIMGNAVNLAARLEGVNKQYNTGGIVISEHTRAQLGDEFLLRRLDRVRVVGVSTPLRIYELLARIRNASAEEVALVETWESALDLYEAREFEKACSMFEELARKDASDTVVPLYLERCKEFLQQQPAADWDGVFSLVRK